MFQEMDSLNHLKAKPFQEIDREHLKAYTK